MAYPNPCENCHRTQCQTGRECRKYKNWINWNWATFRGYVARKKSSKATVKKWVYQHPDRARDYIKNSPCKGCKLNETCDDPCSAYLEWWDARMKYFRGVMEHERAN